MGKRTQWQRQRDRAELEPFTIDQVLAQPDDARVPLALIARIQRMPSQQLRVGLETVGIPVDAESDTVRVGDIRTAIRKHEAAALAAAAGVREAETEAA